MALTGTAIAVSQLSECLQRAIPVRAVETRMFSFYGTHNLLYNIIYTLDAPPLAVSLDTLHVGLQNR